MSITAKLAKPKPRTAIALAEKDRVIVRGLDLCTDLIGHVTLSEYFVFLMSGAKPSPALGKLVDACMVAIAEHGLVPSVQAARMTLAAAPDALQGAVAAGLLGCGSVILGASEVAGQLLAGVLADAASGDKSLDEAATAALAALRSGKQSLPGFGHPIHRDGDPRAARLLAYAKELGTYGAHCDALAAVQRNIAAVYGRDFPLNVSGAIPAVLLDAGFPLVGLRGIPIVARAAALMGHLIEEKESSIGFPLAEIAMAGIEYDGGYPADATR